MHSYLNILRSSLTPLFLLALSRVEGKRGTRGELVRHKNLLFVLLSVLFMCMPVSAEKPEWAAGLFKQGNTAYENGDYDSAITVYQTLIDNGITNADVYYNMANAFFRKNMLGYAILYFEKAAVLAPDDEDIRANLKFAETSVIDKVSAPPESFLARALKKISGLISIHTNTVLVSVLLFLLCIIIIIGMFAGYNGRLLMVYTGTIILICLLAASGNLAYKIHRFENLKYAVVLNGKVDALSEPDGSQTLFSVHEGTKFLIRKRLEDWVLVSLPNGMAGWVEADKLGEI